MPHLEYLQTSIEFQSIDSVHLSDVCGLSASSTLNTLEITKWNASIYVTDKTLLARLNSVNCTKMAAFIVTIWPNIRTIISSGQALNAKQEEELQQLHKVVSLINQQIPLYLRPNRAILK
ncbi:hypothetical protein FRC12_018547 [Ceratobasidium sp. 428]|nr:hypothetical protein FRC12_018547 [Ceratobasidium sp. 428]